MPGKPFGDNRFEVLVEASPNALLMVDKDGIIALVNRQAEILFGYDRSELVGMAVEVLVPRRIRDRHASLRDQFFSEPMQRELGAGRDLTAVRKDGSEVTVEIGLTPISAPDRIFVLATITDITWRKQAEESNRKMADELRASNHDLEQFASMVSHDLQQPLVVISNYLNVLKKRESGKLDPESQNCINVVLDAAKHMHEMIHDMLDYARVGSSKNPFASTDLDDVLRHALFTFEAEIKGTKATIIHNPLPTVMGDQRQLTQVFQNLLGNALKFRNAARPLVIEFGARKEQTGWLIWLQDNGIGMEPDKQDRIFEPFQRLHSQDEFAGMGLGLAICRKIVERHGGRIWAESEPDKGANFFFTIPDRPI